MHCKHSETQVMINQANSSFAINLKLHIIFSHSYLILVFSVISLAPLLTNGSIRIALFYML
jgi:hypothetical protein